jgi:hypothetical protein
MAGYITINTCPGDTLDKTLNTAAITAGMLVLNYVEFEWPGLSGRFGLDTGEVKFAVYPDFTAIMHHTGSLGGKRWHIGPRGWEVVE